MSEVALLEPARGTPRTPPPHPRSPMESPLAALGASAGVVAASASPASGWASPLPDHVAAVEPLQEHSFSVSVVTYHALRAATRALGSGWSQSAVVRLALLEWLDAWCWAPGAPWAFAFSGQRGKDPKDAEFLATPAPGPSAWPLPDSPVAPDLALDQRCKVTINASVSASCVEAVTALSRSGLVQSMSEAYRCAVREWLARNFWPLLEVQRGGVEPRL